VFNAERNASAAPVPIRNNGSALKPENPNSTMMPAAESARHVAAHIPFENASPPPMIARMGRAYAAV
jgi:hypothetical protein